MKTKQEHIELAEKLIQKMTLREKLNIIIETSPENERLGIKKYYHGNEALHGVVRPGTYTVFPQAIAMGAMFDDKLIEKIADAISTQSRARYHNGCADGLDKREFDGRYNGLLAFWSPDLNIARDPRWGRTAETYGEDPYLIGKCGIAFVKGLQGNDKNFLKAIATPKHFVANNEEHNRFECDAKMDKKSLHEYYLEPFRMCRENAEPEAIMAAYNGVNGTPCHESYSLLTDILRKKWGFEGYVVSDCGAVARLWDRHKRFEDPWDAAAAAMNAGVDLECGGYSPYEHFYTSFLEEQVKCGKVSQSRIDEATKRVLIARIKAGQFSDETQLPWAKLTLDDIDCKEHSDLSYESAAKSVVLLKNNGILPLSTKKKIVVIGNNADKCQFGDYSGKPKSVPISIIDGVKKHCPNATLIRWDYIQSSSAFTAISENCYVLDDGSKGVSAAFYDNPVRAGMPKCRIDTEVNYEWLNRYPDPLITTTEFSCLFKGNIKAPLSGEYTFRVSAGGYKKCCPPELTIDGNTYDGEPIYLKKDESVSFMITYSKQLDDPFVRLEWTTPTEIDENELFASEIEAAKEAEIVIAALGLGTQYESEGTDKTDLRLPEEQLVLLRRIYEVNKNIVLILQNGSALDLSEPTELSAAIIEAWYPGDRGGEAIADILFGKISPSGRLPLAFPKATEDLPKFDDYYVTHGRSYMYRKTEPLYDFGYGLSYTTFEYSAISGDSTQVSITIKNTGSFEAEEVAQLYIDSMGLENQPRVRLKGFSRVHLKPNESCRVSFELSDDSFALFDEAGERKIISGCYKVYIDGHLPDDKSNVIEVII